MALFSRSGRIPQPSSTRRRSGAGESLTRSPLRAGELLQRRLSGEPAARPELFLDPEELIVLGDAIRPAGRSGLDLPCRRGDGEIRDRRVLGLPRAVRDDARVDRKSVV